MTQIRLLPKQPNRVSLHKLCGCGSLHKAKAAVTNVGKYVAKHEDKTAKKVERVLAEQSKKIAAQVAKLYVNKMLKAEWNEEDHPRDEDGKFAGSGFSDALESDIRERLAINNEDPDVEDKMTREDVIMEFMQDSEEGGHYTTAHRKELREYGIKTGMYIPVTQAQLDRMSTTGGKKYAFKQNGVAYTFNSWDALPTEKMLKADSTTAIVQSILAELELTGLSVSIVESLTPELLQAFSTAGIVGVAQVGINATAKITRQIDVAALAYATEHGAELVKGLSLTTEDALRSEITRAMKDGNSAQELAKSIRELGAFSRSRASTIARTELATAHIQGNVQGWRETGMVSGKEWIMGDLHDIEDVCDLNAMKGQIGLDEEFEDGIMFPPAHPNCICDVLPVLADEVTN